MSIHKILVKERLTLKVFYAQGMKSRIDDINIG